MVFQVKDQVIERVSPHPEFYSDTVVTLITEMIKVNSAKLMNGENITIHSLISHCQSEANRTSFNYINVRVTDYCDRVRNNVMNS